MAQLYGMEQVVTGLELMRLEGVVRGPDDGSLNLIFRGTNPFKGPEGLGTYIVWIASDAEGNGNGAMHIESEGDPIGVTTKIIQ
tara:strand:+ start:1802 stop:2053 length:252 start_codon:yes stop_codon:yes gene_type:complete